MNRLMEIRTDFNLSLRKLSELTGVAFSTIAREEHEDRPINEKHLRVYTEFFKCSADYILGLSNTGIQTACKTPQGFIYPILTDEQYKKHRQEIRITPNYTRLLTYQTYRDICDSVELENATKFIQVYENDKIQSIIDSVNDLSDSQLDVLISFLKVLKG